MTGFPDESTMPRSDDGSEPIRGGSVGFNRILNLWVEASRTDRSPRFHGVVMSALTIFNSVWSADKSLTDMEEGFVKDVNLFLEYFDAYLSHVWGRSTGNKYCPVIIYFPDYHRLPHDIQRDHTGQRGAQMDLYKQFLKKHGKDEGEVRKLEHCRCFWILAGSATLPHKEVVRKFREITSHPLSLYTSGDPICLITHLPLDLHIAGRLRGIHLLERYTAKILKPQEFHFKIDKGGHVPFQSATHVILGDSYQIKPMITPKVKKQLLEAAEKDRWLTRSAEDVRQRISAVTTIPVSTLKKYDFV